MWKAISVSQNFFSRNAQNSSIYVQNCEKCTKYVKYLSIEHVLSHYIKKITTKWKFFIIGGILNISWRPKKKTVKCQDRYSISLYSFWKFCTYQTLPLFYRLIKQFHVHLNLERRNIISDSKGAKWRNIQHYDTFSYFIPEMQILLSISILFVVGLKP